MREVAKVQGGGAQSAPTRPGHEGSTDQALQTYASLRRNSSPTLARTAFPLHGNNLAVSGNGAEALQICHSFRPAAGCETRKIIQILVTPQKRAPAPRRQFQHDRDARKRLACCILPNFKTIPSVVRRWREPTAPCPGRSDGRRSPARARARRGGHRSAAACRSGSTGAECRRASRAAFPRSPSGTRDS